MKKFFLLSLFCVLLFFSIVSWKYYSLIFREEAKVKVIVAANNEGQLCNQLWHFAHLIAYCKENGYELYNPAFYHYAKHFEHFQYDLAISPFTPLKIYSPFMQELQRRCHRIVKHVLKNHYLENRHVFNVSPASPLPKELTLGNHFFYDWLFDSSGLEKYRPELVELLKPKEEYVRHIDQFWKSIDRTRLTVGVHIRHGDFRVWNNGNSFYSTRQIKERMAEIAERYASLKPQFIIYSDEKQSAEDFSGLDIILTDGQFIEDLYSMARCDLILGVGASTYNAWAAWYGNVPRIKLEESTDWTRVDSFFNGSIFPASASVNDAAFSDQKRVV